MLLPIEGFEDMRMFAQSNNDAKQAHYGSVRGPRNRWRCVVGNDGSGCDFSGFALLLKSQARACATVVCVPISEVLFGSFSSKEKEQREYLLDCSAFSSMTDLKCPSTHSELVGARYQ